jgi:pentatricopeptide repeat protein
MNKKEKEYLTIALNKIAHAAREVAADLIEAGKHEKAVQLLNRMSSHDHELRENLELPEDKDAWAPTKMDSF